MCKMDDMPSATRVRFADRGLGVVLTGQVTKSGTHWLAPRILDCHAWILLVAGGGWFEDAAGRVKVAAGDMLSLVPECWHSYGPGEVGGHWEELFVVASGRIWDGLVADGVLPAAGGVLRRTSAGVTPRFAALVAAKRHDGQAQPRLAAELHAVLVEAAIGGRQPAWLERAEARLSADLRGALPIPALAAELNLDHARFRKEFRRLTGLPPAAWRLRRRLDAAQTALIEEPGLTLAELAERLGFCDAFEFSKIFRRHCGLSPSAFRRGW